MLHIACCYIAKCYILPVATLPTFKLLVDSHPTNNFLTATLPNIHVCVTLYGGEVNKLPATLTAFLSTLLKHNFTRIAQAYFMVRFKGQRDFNSRCRQKMAFTGVTNAHGPSQQSTACTSLSCSMTTQTNFLRKSY